MSTCNGCGATIDWIRTKDRRYMPVEPESVFIVEGDGSGRYVTDEGEVITGRRALLSEQKYFAKWPLSHIGRTARKPVISGMA